MPGRQEATASPAGAAPVQSAPVEVAKREDARTVLVIGDFFRGGLAEGLATAFAERDTVRVSTRTNGSSASSATTFYNWPRELGGILAAEKAGIGHRHARLETTARRWFVDGCPRTRPQPGLDRAYQQRAKALATALKQAGVPFVWVGTPPFRFTAMVGRHVGAERHLQGCRRGGRRPFVDIWAGFSDENGAFAATGPDINGQPARLRGNDGINLTKPRQAQAGLLRRKAPRAAPFWILGPTAAETGTDKPAVPATCLPSSRRGPGRRSPGTAGSRSTAPAGYRRPKPDVTRPRNCWRHAPSQTVGHEPRGRDGEGDGRKTDPARPRRRFRGRPSAAPVRRFRTGVNTTSITR